MEPPTESPSAANGAAKKTPRQRITPRALLEIKRPGDPQVHPDGRRVAFVVTEADFDESRWVSHLWLTEWLTDEPEPNAPPESTAPTEPTGEASAATEDGEERHDPTRQLTFSHEGETQPRWSPDGHYLAFLSARPDPSESEDDEDEDEEPKEQVWILPGDGGEARKLTAAKEGVLDYVWTPDGKAILYLAPEPRPRPIESVRKEERERHKMDAVVEQEDRLRRQFWRVDVEERKPKRVLTADYGVADFALSHDGERLCFATNYTGDWNDYHNVDLWVHNFSEGATFKLVARRGGKYHPRWSPDGKQIAFLTWLDPELSYSRESLFLADAPPVPETPPTEIALDKPEMEKRNGQGRGVFLEASAPAVSEARLAVEAGFDYDISGFEWSPVDNVLYALAAVRTGGEIVRISAETGRWKWRTPDQTEALAATTLHDLNIGPESRVIFYISESATAPPELFVQDAQGQEHALTKLNADFAETYRLPRQEVVRWNSPDGTEVEGVLTYPLDYESGTRYPLIVQVHGGPKGRATSTLRGYTMAPVWSAEGYLSLQPNFRGSEGYGHAFAIANRRDLGGGDFADIMAGVDWSIAQGLADPDRLGITGGSYGGYMTNWAIGHTDRFKAAVSMFGIFHLQTDYSNSDLSGWDNDYLGAYYWEDPEIYRLLSPGSYLENIKTPTLIIHGEDDNNTFISNSKELYQALRHRDVTTQFVHYPREGHGLREPNHKLDEIRRSLAWMDRYVRHGGQNPGVYRLGDRVPSADGLLELCVTHAEIASFLGQPEPKPNDPNATCLLEVAFTLHHRDTRHPATTLTLHLADIRLETGEDASTLLPCGVPLEGPGGKALVEGENLRIALHPEADSGQLALACAAVFRVVKRGGEGLLRVADFPLVALFWTGEEEHEEADHPGGGHPDKSRL